MKTLSIFYIFILALLPVATSVANEDSCYTRSAFYKTFKVGDLKSSKDNHYTIDYRFYMENYLNRYLVTIRVNIDKRMPEDSVIYYHEYDDSAKTTVEYSVQIKTSGGEIETIESEQISFRTPHVFKFLLFLGQNEIFSLPSKISGIEPLHKGGAMFGTDSLVFCERSVAGKNTSLERTLYDDEDSASTRLATALKSFIEASKKEASKKGGKDRKKS